MRLNRTLRIGFALLLALMLPLQGYAAMPACAQHDPSSGAASTTGSQPAQHHCEHGRTQSLHRCDNCCCGIGIALTPAQWTAPLPVADRVADAVLGTPPVVALDRLDRPPRFIPA
jgi:hypothetical protein